MKDVYSEAIIENDLVEVVIPNMRDILSEFTIDKCKIVLMGNNILSADNGIELPQVEPEVINDEIKTCNWFGTKYRIYRRPNWEELRG